MFTTRSVRPKELWMKKLTERVWKFGSFVPGVRPHLSRMVTVNLGTLIQTNLIQMRLDPCSFIEVGRMFIEALSPFDQGRNPVYWSKFVYIEYKPGGRVEVRRGRALFILQRVPRVRPQLLRAD